MSLDEFHCVGTCVDFDRCGSLGLVSFGWLFVDFDGLTRPFCAFVMLSFIMFVSFWFCLITRTHMNPVILMHSFPS